MTVTEDRQRGPEALQPDWDNEARRLYDERFRPLLEPEHSGKMIAIHPESGESEVGRSSPIARGLLRRRCPQGTIVTLSIGPERPDAALDRLLGPAGPV